ncbi:MAG: YSC84-related protein [Geminicoccaceae bacterium]
MPMRRTMIVAVPALAATALLSRPAAAVTRESIKAQVGLALDALERSNPAAKELAAKAKAVLVFPEIVKGGLGFGGSYGTGALIENGNQVKGYYRTFSVSWGLQAGAQSYGYALYFMNEAALAYLRKSGGWEIGVGPSIVVLDKGAAKNFSTTTAKGDIYAFIFDQQGLMAGVGLEGSKISQFTPDS